MEDLGGVGGAAPAGFAASGEAAAIRESDADVSGAGLRHQAGRGERSVLFKFKLSGEGQGIGRGASAGKEGAAVGERGGAGGVGVGGDVKGGYVKEGGEKEEKVEAHRFIVMRWRSGKANRSCRRRDALRK
jgi:hypothetical protein